MPDPDGNDRKPEETMTVEMNTWKQKLVHPNALTLYRIAAVPILVLFLIPATPNLFCTIMAALIFSAASITDYLDGFMARKLGLVSDFGKIMDPLADKLLVSSAFIMLVGKGWVPDWMVCIILGRELAITGLRNVLTAKGEDVAASMLGKYKTGFQIAAIIPLLVHYPVFGLDFDQIGSVLLWFALVFTLWSGGDYIWKARKYLVF